MKYIITLLLCSTSLIGFGQEHTYPKLDQGLIAIWKGADSEDITLSQQFMKVVDLEWSFAKSKLSKIRKRDFNQVKFVKNIDYAMMGLRNCIVDHRFEEIQNFTYQILWDFSEMRKALEITGYPIDPLLMMHIYYSEIHYTVHDQEMGLLHWFEFEELVDDFAAYCEMYDDIKFEQIKQYFNEIDSNAHVKHKKKLRSCLEKFLDALKSGYTDDFEMPCDDLGRAVQDLVWMYSKEVSGVVGFNN